MWEIYSVGDAAFLERILNSLAMLSGTGSYEKVAGIGMLVGLIILGFQSIIQGGTGIRFQNLLVSWIIYAMIFGAGARVAIEDVYSGHVRVVDNVPFGVAAAGSMVSQLGYGVTRLFEQSFGEAQMTSNGFAFSLETLANLRKMSLTKASLGAANSPAPKDDYWQSWTNYIADCTLVGVDQGAYTVADIQRGRRPDTGATSSDIMNLLRYDSNSFGTRIMIQGAATNGFMTCSDAHNALTNGVVRSRFQSALLARASQQLGVPLYSVQGAVQSAFEAIDQTAVDSQNYMLATVMAPIFEWAMVDNEVNFQKSAVATMLHTAIQKRNEQWGAEQALFNTVVRPMMTFFEGLVYAITPMMAFLIGLGPMGITLIGKYLMIILWIQLWMPVLSIINLYLHMAVSGRMAALQDPGQGGLPLDSFYGIYSMDQTLQTWIATGGMLAASVPAITLMLIYGGAIAASGVASRMSSGNVPSDVSTPAMSQTGPLFERASMRNASDAQSMSTTGSKGLSMAIKGGYDTSLASSREEVEAKQASFLKQFSSSVSSGAQSSEQAQTSLSRAVSSLSEDSELFQALAQGGEEYSRANGLSVSDNKSEMAQLGAQRLLAGSFDAGLGLSLGGRVSDDPATNNPATGKPDETNDGKRKGASAANINSSGRLTNSLSSAEEVRTQVSGGSASEQNTTRGAREGHGFSAQTSARIANALARQASDSESSSFMNTLGVSNDESLSRSAAETLTASDKYAATNSLTRSMGVLNSLDDNRIPQELRNRGMVSDINEFFSEYGHLGGGDFGSGQSLYDTAADYQEVIQGKGSITNPNEAALAARVFALADGRFLDGIENEVVRDSVAIQGANILSRLAGVQAPNQNDYNLNSGGDASYIPESQASGVRKEAVATATGPNTSRQEVEDTVNHGRATGRQILNDPDDEVTGYYENARDRAQERAGANESDYNQRAVPQIQREVRDLSLEGIEKRATLQAAGNMVGGYDAKTLTNQGLLASFSGDQGFDRLYNNLNEESAISPAVSRNEFLAMSPDERKELASGMQSRVASYFQRQGNLSPGTEHVAAAVAMPYILNKHLNENTGGLEKLTTSGSETWEAVTSTTLPMTGETMGWYAKHAERSTGSAISAATIVSEIGANFNGAMLSENAQTENLFMGMSNRLVDHAQVTPWVGVDRSAQAEGSASSSLPTKLPDRLSSPAPASQSKTTDEPESKKDQGEPQPAVAEVSNVQPANPLTPQPGAGTNPGMPPQQTQQMNVADAGNVQQEDKPESGNDALSGGFGALVAAFSKTDPNQPAETLPQGYADNAQQLTAGVDGASMNMSSSDADLSALGAEAQGMLARTDAALAAQGSGSYSSTPDHKANVVASTAPAPLAVDANATNQASEVENMIPQLENTLASVGPVAPSDTSQLQNHAHELQQQLQQLQASLSSGASPAEISGMLEQAQHTANLLESSGPSYDLPADGSGPALASSEALEPTPDPFAPEYTSPAAEGAGSPMLAQNDVLPTEPAMPEPIEPALPSSMSTQDHQYLAQNETQPIQGDAADPFGNAGPAKAWYENDKPTKKDAGVAQAIADYADKPAPKNDGGPSNPMIS